MWWFASLKKQHIISHNPYFNRWFSAIKDDDGVMVRITCHNPYFNRWFSVMCISYIQDVLCLKSQSLF